MIYITGDTHGTRNFGKLLDDDYKNLSKNDYLIICGDCGVIFSKDSSRIINLYQYLPYTVLFVDGNHENFDILDQYPVTLWHGGKIHKISDTVFHLIRGQVYFIDGYSFLAFGGALSFDKARRIPGISWWNQEEPTISDFSEAKKNLIKHNNTVDFVISHDCPISWMGATICSKKVQHDGLIESDSNIYLENILKAIRFRHWFFGHYHEDNDIDTYATELFDRVVSIKQYCHLDFCKGEAVSGLNSKHAKCRTYIDKKIILLGDSTCTFFEETKDAFYDIENSGDTYVYTQNDTWWGMITNALGAHFESNQSVVRITETEIITNFIHITPFQDSQDYIVFVAVGTDAFINQISPDDFRNFIKKMLFEIQRILPSANIFVLEIPKETVYDLSTNTTSISNYNEMMKCNNYPQDNIHYFSFDALGSDYYCDSSLHFNRKGMYLFSRLVYAKLLKT